MADACPDRSAVGKAGRGGESGTRGGESGTGTILTRWGVLDYGSAMARAARVAPGGMVFHVLNRGVARMQLFEKAADYQAFEQVLQDTLDQSPMRICAYAVMPNHWHLLFVAGVRWRVNGLHATADDYPCASLARTQGLCGIGPCLPRSMQIVSGGERRAFLGCGPIR